LGAVAVAAMPFAPAHLFGVTGYIRSSDMMMMPLLGSAQTAEITFRLIDARFVIGIFDGVIDAPHIKVSDQFIRKRLTNRIFCALF
jgi:hypothetical protein